MRYLGDCNLACIKLIFRTLEHAKPIVCYELRSHQTSLSWPLLELKAIYGSSSLHAAVCLLIIFIDVSITTDCDLLPVNVRART